MEVMRERQFAKSSQRTDGLISGVWRAIYFSFLRKCKPTKIIQNATLDYALTISLPFKDKKERSRKR
jgi:hypothetical protein